MLLWAVNPHEVTVHIAHDVALEAADDLLLGQPRFETLLGERACFIFPSRGQPSVQDHAAAMLIPFPHPDPLGYKYLDLVADRTHLLGIAKTLRFIAPKG